LAAENGKTANNVPHKAAEGVFSPETILTLSGQRTCLYPNLHPPKKRPLKDSTIDMQKTVAYFDEKLPLLIFTEWGRCFLWK